MPYPHQAAKFKAMRVMFSDQKKNLKNYLNSINFVLNSHSLLSVSYTHLDVYKRQILVYKPYHLAVHIEGAAAFRCVQKCAQN